MSNHDEIKLCDTKPVEQLLAAARNGSLESEGQLLETFRDDLIEMVQADLGPEMWPKLTSSDLVQESLLEAHRDFTKFRGESAAEFRGWLKRIVLNNLVNRCRHWKAQRRDFRRESGQADDTTVSPDDVAGSSLTGSAIASRREQAECLIAALNRLCAEDQQVIELRHRECLPFSEIGRQMSRSPDAARMLWYRAFDRLSRELDRDPTDGQHGKRVRHVPE